ncbi:IctB family putative bicarbonate transporter [Prochlorothrix hollandica]|uniref:IctB family putative bicarbonate transporter n=1 Tax=Prochlorothrix hollandica TaxID=1223 RepID=UPI003341F682
MDSVWQSFTFSRCVLTDWARRSFLYRVLSSGEPWRASSWLLQWADPLGLVLVALVLVLAPFVSNALIGVLLLAIAAFWVMLAVTEAPGQGLTPIHLLLTLYWAIATVATVFSPVRSVALEGWTKLSLYLIFFGLMARVLRSPRLRNGLITTYLLTALVVSAYGIRQWFLGATALATWVDPTSPLADTTRVYSYLGNPNLLGGYLLPAIFLGGVAMFAWEGWGCKALALFMTAINTLCIGLTLSRGAWIGLVAGGLVLVVLLLHWWSRHWTPFWRTWAIPLGLLALALVLAVGIITVEPLRLRIFSMFEGRADSSNNFRLNVWAAVLEMIRDRPILGIGPGNDAFNSIYPLYQRPRYTALSAYSVVLELAVETGFIGLSCFFWMLVTTWTQGWVALQRLRQGGNAQGYWLMGAIATSVGLLSHGLVDTVWYRPQISSLWWLQIALVASYYQAPPARVAAAEVAASPELPPP